MPTHIEGNKSKISNSVFVLKYANKEKNRPLIVAKKADKQITKKKDVIFDAPP